jgi:hypothetical protein
MFYAMYRTSGWAVLYYMALIILGNFLVSCRERAQKPALACGHMHEQCPTQSRLPASDVGSVCFSYMSNNVVVAAAIISHVLPA